MMDAKRRVSRKKMTTTSSSLDDGVHYWLIGSSTGIVGKYCGESLTVQQFYRIQPDIAVDMKISTKLTTL